LTTPRIPALTDAELTPEQTEVLLPFRGAPVLNIFRTLVHAPKALQRFNDWATYVLSRRNDLSARDREIVILRVGFLCRSGYEFAQHTRIGRDAGLTDDEIARIKAGAQAGWEPAQAALIRATDELHADQFVTDPTWAELRRHYSQKQCMDVVFTAAQYTQVSMILNTFGVQLEPGVALDPDLRAF
jgi:alkylhydroperoxidase family enzyme